MTLEALNCLLLYLSLHSEEPSPEDFEMNLSAEFDVVAAAAAADFDVALCKL